MKTPSEWSDDLSARRHALELLRRVGARDEPNPEAMARARSAARQQWREAVRERRAGRLLSHGAAAAIVGLLIGAAAWFTHLSQTSASIVAGTIRVVGQPQLAPERGAAAVPLAPGTTIAAGAEVQTDVRSAAALRLTSGLELRIASASAILVATGERVSLERGALFVSASARSPGAELQVRTSHGVLRHVGTQYQASLERGSLRVRVREGQVLWQAEGRSDDPLRVSAGEELLVGGDARAIVRPAPMYGAAWNWVEALAGEFQLDGRTLAEFLVWVARETGLRVTYAASNGEVLAQRTVLHGSVRGLTPTQALGVVLPASGVRYRLEEGELWVDTGA